LLGLAAIEARAALRGRYVALEDLRGARAVRRRSVIRLGALGVRLAAALVAALVLAVLLLILRLVGLRGRRGARQRQRHRRRRKEFHRQVLPCPVSVLTVLSAQNWTGVHEPALNEIG
jgi:hypothetical protein